MTKLVNRVSFVVFIIVAIVSWITYHEEMDVEIPYLKELFLATSIFMGLLLFLKANYRWQAVFLAKRAKNYFDASIKGLKKALVYEVVNIGFYALLSSLLLIFLKEAHIIGWVLFFYFIEGILNLSQKLFGLGYKTIIQENAITIVTNYVTVIPMKEIVKIESRHRDIWFVDTTGKTYLLDIDLIKKEQQEGFISQVKDIAYRKDIYFDVAFERDERY